MTKEGPPQIGTLNPYVRTEAETICWSSGIETEKCSEGGMNVGFIENGDYIKVKGVNFGTGAASFEARVASATNGGNIEIRLDSPTGKLVGTCTVTGTGGWQTWTTKSCPVSGAEGVHDLYFVFKGGSGYLFNIDWWKFTPANPDPTPTPMPDKRLGDLNNDGKVNSTDFQLLKMHVLRQELPAGNGPFKCGCKQRRKSGFQRLYFVKKIYTACYIGFSSKLKKMKVWCGIMVNGIIGIMTKRHMIVIMALLFTVSVLSAGLLFINTVNAAEPITYYVSPTGSDSNTGTIDAPFKTIAKARDVVRTVNGNMKSDIYVYLRGGTYNITETITFGPQDSGTNGYRIYYMAYPGETPVLSGATKVTGWTRHNGNIYKAKLNRSTKLRNLYVNDQRASMTSKRVTARGGHGTYTVTAGQAPWAWTSGAKATVFGMICRKYRKLPAIKMTLR